MYAGKRLAYNPQVYKTQTLLAAIDYNLHPPALHSDDARGKALESSRGTSPNKSPTADV